MIIPRNLVIFIFLLFSFISSLIDVLYPKYVEDFNVLVLIDENIVYLLLSKHYQKTVLHTFLISTHKNQEDIFGAHTFFTPLWLMVVFLESKSYHKLCPS